MKVENEKHNKLKLEPWRAVDAQVKTDGLKMESWRVYRPVFQDSYHFDEEQDPDPH
jgi:hypothetical protein